MARPNRLQTVDGEIYEVVIDEWENRFAGMKEPKWEKEVVLIDMDPVVELHDEDVLPPPGDYDVHDGGLLSDVDEDEVDHGAPAS